MTGKVVLFGAGATGRGHVGLLAWQAGCDLVLVDRNPELVNLLKAAGSYRVQLYAGQAGPSTGRFEEVTVSGYQVFHAAAREAVAREIVDADLVLTAVFDQNLEDVAKTLQLAVVYCQEAQRQQPLNCIACENMMDSSSSLGRLVSQDLDPAYSATFERIFAFPDCMISRVVPQPKPDPLQIITEDYNEWTVRAEAYRGQKPASWTFFELVNNQTARLERKLFIHNGGHAVCGYFGYHRGHQYIHQAIDDPIVAGQVVGALDELGEVVRRRHGFSHHEIEAYKADLARRGSIAEMKDEIRRVVRDPLRKLSARERLVAPAILAVEYDLPRSWIVQGITAVLRYANPTDAQSVQLQKMLGQNGLQSVLSEVCGIPPSNPLQAEIRQAWDNWDELVSQWR